MIFLLFRFHSKMARMNVRMCECMCVVFYLGRAHTYQVQSIKKQIHLWFIYIRFEQNKNTTSIERRKQNKIIATTVTAFDRQKDRQTSIRLCSTLFAYITIHRIYTEHRAELRAERSRASCSIDVYEVSESMFVSNQLQHIKCCVQQTHIRSHSQSQVCTQVACLLLAYVPADRVLSKLCCFFSSKNGKRKKKKLRTAHQHEQRESEMETRIVVY